MALGWFHLPTEDCRLLPHQPGIFDASSRSAGGGLRGSSVSQALSSRWIGIVRSSIRFSCCSVPGFFLGTSGGGGCEGQGEHRADAGAASASPGHFTGAVFPCLLPAAPAPIPSPPTPSTRRQRGLCWRSRQRALLLWSEPELCAVSSQQSCPQAHPQLLGSLQPKGCSSHSSGSEEGSGQGMGGERCSVLQGRNMTNSVSNF